MPSWSVERRGAIAVATFERPPRNLMSMAAMAELERALSGLADDADVALVVLTGGVPGYFVAHADLDDLAALGRGEQASGDPLVWSRTLALIEDMPQPVVAAVNGQAWGGGCELSLACTLRVAARSAHLGQPEVAVGIIPGAGGTQRLPRAVGPGRAAELVLSGRIVAAEEALAIGLVQAVFPDEGFLDEVVAWAGRITAHPRSAIVAAKRALVQGTRLPLDDGLRLEGRLFVDLQRGPEALALEDEARQRYRDANEDERVRLS